nr:39S ribosomal protein L30, mitochondrial [Anser cygnoides]
MQAVWAPNVLGKRTEGVAPAVWARQMFTRSRIPKEVRAAVVEDTEKRHQPAHQPRLHKNIPSVNSKLKVVKHLIRIQPLKLPYGLPTEEEMSDTFLTSKGELIIRSRLKPVEQKEIKS